VGRLGVGKTHIAVALACLYARPHALSALIFSYLCAGEGGAATDSLGCGRLTGLAKTTDAVCWTAPQRLTPSNSGLNGVAAVSADVCAP
jgi:hypothetical protein